MANENRKKDSGEVEINQKIRYKIKDPYKSLNSTSIEQIEGTMVSYSTSITRGIAARVEMKPLMAQKTEIGIRVHEAFHKKGAGGQMKEVKATINPRSSHIAFIIYVLLFIYLIPLEILNLSLFPTLLIVCLFLFAGLAGWHAIETGHQGVLTKLGSRVKPIKFFGIKFGNLAREGYHWIPWPFFSYISVDVREKTIPNRDIKVMAGTAEDAGNTIPDNMADQIDASYGPDSGADVLAVITEEVMPVNKKLIESMEARMIEQGESEAQDLDMRRQAERAKNLKAILPGIPDIEAIRAVQSQEKQMVREEVIVTVNGTGKVDELVGGAIAIGHKYMKERGKNKQDKGKKKGEK